MSLRVKDVKCMKVTFDIKSVDLLASMIAWQYS